MNRWVCTAALVCGCSSPIEALEPVEPPRTDPSKHAVRIELAQTAAAEAFRALLPLTLTMYELNGNEKYAELPSALPIEASNPGTIRAGDVMLYGARTLVVFYKTPFPPPTPTRRSVG